jgi:hypothetical protein
MSLFVFSVVAGVLIHQLVTIVQPEHMPSNRYRRVLFGRRIIVWLPERSYLVVKAASFATAGLLFVLTTILIVAQSFHPAQGYAFRFADAITSPRMAATIFGGFVGLLLGNLINRILRGGGNYAFKPADWLEIAFIAISVILGIGGEEVIRSSAARISKVSIGATTEIAFSERQPKTPNLSVEHVNNALKASGGAGSDYLRAGGSAGLSINANLGNIVARDRNYLNLFRGHERQPGPDVQARLRLAENFVRTTISPYSSCLAGILARTANGVYVEEQLAGMVDDYQRLTSQAEDPTENRSTVKGNFVEQMRSVGKEAYGVALKGLLEKKSGYSEEEIQFIRACTPLVSVLCVPVDNEGKPKDTPWLDQEKSTKWLIGSNEAGDIEISKENKENIETATHCLADRWGPPPLVTDVPKAPTGSGGLRADQDFNLFEGWIPKNVRGEITELPYLTIAYAGFLAQLGYYDAAALALHGWISQARDLGLPTSWYIIRARFYLAGYLEEWIRTKGDSTPLSLRQYHIDNFAAIIGAMARSSTISEAQRLSGDSKLEIGPIGATFSGDDGDCNAKSSEERKQFGDLYQSYISAVAGFIDHSLKHPENSKKNASIISSYTQQLNKLSLKCLEGDVRKEKRAGILEYYARNQMNLVENNAALGSVEVSQQQLKDAAKVIQLAIEIIDKEQSDERNNKATKSFLVRISSSSLIERYESLLATQARLHEMERRLSDD